MLSACGGGGSSPFSVNAGADIDAVEADDIQLSGSATASDGRTLTLAWSQVSGPAVAFANTAGSTARLTLPPVDVGEEAQVVLRLTATDPAGVAVSDDVRIRVASQDFLVFSGFDGSETRLYRFDPRSAEVTALNDPLPPESGILDMKVSPTGEYVAYRTFLQPGGRFGVSIARTDGSGDALILESRDRTVGPDFLDYGWSPDGSQLAYMLDEDARAVRELYLVNADGSGNTKISQPLASNMVSVGDAQWSPDGRYIAYSIVDDTNIRVLGLDVYDTQAPAAGAVNLVDFGQPFFAGPPRFAWSPASDQLAYTLQEGGLAPVRLFAVTVDSASVAEITQASSTAFSVPFAWSPDGSALAYVLVNDTGTNDELRVTTLAAGSDLLIDALDGNNGGIRDATWSPNGSRLAYLNEANAVADELITVNADGSDPRTINAPLMFGRITLVGWSPDGTRLAYLSDEDASLPGPEFRVAQEDGSGVSVVELDESVVTYRYLLRPWSPDSTALIFETEQFVAGERPVNAWVSDLATGNDARITRANPIGPPGHGEYAFAADGSVIAYISTQDSASTLRRELFLYDRSNSGLVNVSDSAPTPLIIGSWRWWPESPQQ